MISIDERIRAARKSKIEVDGVTYHYRRPTDAEYRWIADADPLDVVYSHVFDWDNIHERDLFPSGSSDVVDFTPNIWREYIDDRPELWNVLVSEISGAYVDYIKSKSDEGNV